jgi:transposase
MFIRRKIKTLKSKTYQQHQLLKSIRTSQGPRQQVVLNMGELKLPKQQWKALANSIEAKLNNQSAFAFEENNPEVERLAGHYAQMILSKQLNEHRDTSGGKALQEGAESVDKPADYRNVDVNSVTTSQSKSIGAEYVIADQMNRYGLAAILQRLDFSAKQIDYAKELIIGRAVHPSSERELARWIEDDSAVKELIGSDERVYDNALHRTALLLWEHRVSIEQSLRQAAKELFLLDEAIILYDLTNTYFEGKKSGSIRAQFGKSKERRSDCKLMTLALVVDALGFPKESHVLEGNVSEPGTLTGMLEMLKSLGSANKRKTIVIDAGIATEETIELLRAQQFSYIAISRKQSYDPQLWAQSREVKLPLTDRKTELSVRLAIVESRTEDEEVSREALLLCSSPQKAIKEQQIVEKRMHRFEAELESIHAGLSRPRTQKKYGKIMERIGRLKQKYGVGNCYDIEIEQQDSVVKAISFKKNPTGESKSEGFGAYVIRTDRVDLDESALSLIHRSLSVIESSFRSMKSELGLRPNYHKSETATLAHLFLSVLAYHMVCPVLNRLSQSGLNYTWNSVRNMLSSHDRIVTSFNTREGECIHVRNTTQANLNQKTIYNALGINHDPLKNIMVKQAIKMTRGL